METTNLKTPVRNTILFLASLIMVLSLSSCALKKPFLLSSVVPAARGTVTIKSDKNKNYDIKIQITNLAEANRLPGEKNTYVVWMETEGNVIKNLGQIKSSSGVLSKQLKASLDTKSSLRPSKIFVTVEFDANPQYPAEQVVLTTDKF